VGRGQGLSGGRNMHMVDSPALTQWTEGECGGGTGGTLQGQ
jgi:hypothetical protein